MEFGAILAWRRRINVERRISCHCGIENVLQNFVGQSVQQPIRASQTCFQDLEICLLCTREDSLSV